MNQQADHVSRTCRARARRLMRREAEAVEEEHEQGEINLVPFLDILVNTIIFLLATSALAAPLAQIKAQMPAIPPDESTEASRPGPDTSGKEPLDLTVVASRAGFILAQSGRVHRGPDGDLPTIRCMLRLQRGICPAFAATRAAAGGRASGWVDGYDYAALTRSARELKKRFSNERRVHVMADGNVPYQVVVRTMDSLRGLSTARCTGQDGCLFDRVVFGTGVQ